MTSATLRHSARSAKSAKGRRAGENSTGSPASTWTSKARLAAAIAFVLTGVFWVLGDIGGTTASGVAQLTWMAKHSGLATAGTIGDILAVPFLFAVVVVWFLLAKAASPKLAWTGLALGVAGVTGQAMISGVEIVQLAIARDGRLDFSTFNSITNNGIGAPGAVFWAMFMIGAFVGTTIAVVAVWRARALSRTGVVLWLAFNALSIVGMAFDTSFVALAALAVMAVSLVRTRVPAEAR